MKFQLRQGDNLELLKKLPDNSVDSVVTDPPYGLSFMNKKWDYDVPSVELWKEVYRVLKPGGYVLSFGGTRTYHRMVVNIEDAGFEIRDQIMWLYGSGFPKSHNIGLSIDKKQGHPNRGHRIAVASRNHPDGTLEPNGEKLEKYEAKTDEGKKYEGWGTNLKPANEPICVARKPLSEKSVALNVLKWGTGGINIDGCRVVYKSETDKESAKPGSLNATGDNSMFGLKSGNKQNEEGRFPANIILDEIAGEMLDKQSGMSITKANMNYNHNKTESDSDVFKSRGTYTPRSDSGGASRFFYQAKVSKKERNMGLEHFEDKVIEGRDPGQDERSVAYKPRPTATKNIHPTVKPVNLMAYLCRLITPPGGTILDPYMGSGSTGITALLEGFNFIGMDLDPEYVKIAEARISNYEKYREFLRK